MKSCSTILFAAGIVTGASFSFAQNVVYPTDSVYTVQPFVFHAGFTDNYDTAGEIGIMANLGQNIIFPVTSEGDTTGQGFWYQVQFWRKHNPIIPGVQDSLLQNTPNPFNPSTYIPFLISSDLHGRRSVHIVMYLTSILGIRVRTIFDGYYTAGEYGVVLNANGIASGVYFYTMTVDDDKAPHPLHFEFARKLVLLR